jgi:uncharacterized RDD family membrane protein YckC
MLTIIGGDGKPYGPVPEDQVRRWLTEGRATADTMAQRSGETEWRKLGDFPEFSSKPQEKPVFAEPKQEETSPLEEQHGAASASESVAEPVLAGRLVRLCAWGIDCFISFVFALPGLIMIVLKLIKDGLDNFDPEHITPEQLGNGLTWLMAGLFIVTVFQCWLLTVRGQTVGKRVLGIRIVGNDSDEDAGFVRVVLLRSFVPGMIGSITYMGLGLCFAIVDIGFIFRPDRRCVHDHLAGTKVVEDTRNNK